jgi:branched-chain amino acid transport system permease protein
MTWQLLLSACVSGALYAVIALSLNLIYGTMRLLDVAHGEFVMVGAFAGYFLVTLLGVPPVLALLGAFALNGLAGLALYQWLFAGIIRRARSTESLESTSLLVFFGLSVILQNGAALAFGGTPRAYERYARIVHVGGVAITGNRLVAMAACVLAVVAVLVFFARSTWGLAIRALIANRDAAAIVGIDTQAAFRLTCVLGFGLAGYAGAVIGLMQPVSPFMGGQYLMIGFVIIVLGGVGKLVGSVVGGVLIALLETVGTQLTGPNYRDILIYGTFIAVLLLRPQGIFGRRAA